MTVLSFRARNRIEVFSVKDRSDGRMIHICELVGTDKHGRFRIDVAHAHTLSELLSFVIYWESHGANVQDVGVYL